MDRRRFLSAASALTGVALLLAVLAIAGAWPFGASSTTGEGRHVVWQGDVALQREDLYELDVLPLRPESNCVRCLSLASAHGRLTLLAGNGILGWPGQSAPSYGDCVAQRNKEGTLDSVLLEAPRTSLDAVALHGWACATGGGNDGLLRLRYDGRQGGRYLFSVTSWGRPAEG